jgi:hypothetical protein
MTIALTVIRQKAQRARDLLNRPTTYQLALNAEDRGDPKQDAYRVSILENGTALVEEVATGTRLKPSSAIAEAIQLLAAAQDAMIHNAKQSAKK